MSNVGAGVQSDLQSSSTAFDVSLVASLDTAGRIAEVLVRHGLEFCLYADTDVLREQSTDNRVRLVVLCIDEQASGLAAQVESLRQCLPQAPLIVVCPEIERWGVRAALAAGASGVVAWEELGLALAPCIDAALAGQTCVPRVHWRQIDPPALSAREKQILGLVVMGYMNSQIAQQLFLAESTVKSHLSSAFGKLGVRSRNEAVNLILDPERGLGMGILALVGEEPLASTSASAL